MRCLAFSALCNAFVTMLGAILLDVGYTVVHIMMVASSLLQGAVSWQ